MGYGEKINPYITSCIRKKSSEKNSAQKVREMVKLQGFKVGPDTFPVGTGDGRREVAGSVENKDHLSPQLKL